MKVMESISSWKIIETVKELEDFVKKKKKGSSINFGLYVLLQAVT